MFAYLAHSTETMQRPIWVSAPVDSFAKNLRMEGVNGH